MLKVQKFVHILFSLLELDMSRWFWPPKAGCLLVLISLPERELILVHEPWWWLSFRQSNYTIIGVCATIGVRNSFPRRKGNREKHVRRKTFENFICKNCFFLPFWLKQKRFPSPYRCRYGLTDDTLFCSEGCF